MLYNDDMYDTLGTNDINDTVGTLGTHQSVCAIHAIRIMCLQGRKCLLKDKRGN